MKRLLVVAALLLTGVMAVSSEVAYSRELRVTEEEVYCLALNDYYEARGEPNEGRVAVAFVVLNRVLSIGHPSTICEAVSQNAKGYCAFTWACNRYSITEPESWLNSQSFARAFLQMYRKLGDPTLGATQYHELSITPYWAKDYEFNIVIGDHVFYPKHIARKD